MLREKSRGDWRNWSSLDLFQHNFWTTLAQSHENVLQLASKFCWTLFQLANRKKDFHSPILLCLLSNCFKISKVHKRHKQNLFFFSSPFIWNSFKKNLKFHFKLYVKIFTHLHKLDIQKCIKLCKFLCSECTNIRKFFFLCYCLQNKRENNFYLFKQNSFVKFAFLFCTVFQVLQEMCFRELLKLNCYLTLSLFLSLPVQLKFNLFCKFLNFFPLE